MNYQKSGYPFLRYYDRQRQQLVKSKLKEQGYKISESFFMSQDFNEWFSVDESINEPQNYQKYCNPYTPNIIWGLTIQL